MDAARGIAETGGMSSDRTLRVVFRAAALGLALTLAAYGGLFAALAWPDPLFRHARGGGLVTFHATSSLPPEATTLAEKVTAAFVASPLGLPAHEVDIWLVDEGWPVRLFFAGSPRASGLTYPVTSTRNVFLRHADIEANRLRRGSMVVPPPRTLSYYLIHEITHLMVADRVGAWRIVRMPRWVNEGFADYVALGPALRGWWNLPPQARHCPRRSGAPTGARGSASRSHLSGCRAISTRFSRSTWRCRRAGPVRWLRNSALRVPGVAPNLCPRRDAGTQPCWPTRKSC
jgi:hypothetical protein